MIPDFKTADERDEWIKTNADYWTVVRFHGVGHYERHEFKDRLSAETAARRMLVGENYSKPFMVYAIADGHDCLVTTIKPETQ